MSTTNPLKFPKWALLNPPSNSVNLIAYVANREIMWHILILCGTLIFNKKLHLSKIAMDGLESIPNPLTIKLILYKLLSKSYYITFYIIKILWNASWLHQVDTISFLKIICVPFFFLFMLCTHYKYIKIINTNLKLYCQCFKNYIKENRIL